MESELSELIDTALARRSSLIGLLSRVIAKGDGNEALTVEYQIAELDGILALVTRTSVIH